MTPQQQQQLKAMYDKVCDRVEAYKAIHDLSEEEYEKRMQQWYAFTIEKMKAAFVAAEVEG